MALSIERYVVSLSFSSVDGKKQKALNLPNVENKEYAKVPLIGQRL